MKTDMSTLGFILRKKYRELPDDVIVELGDAVRVRLLLWTAGPVCMLVATLIGAATRVL